MSATPVSTRSWPGWAKQALDRLLKGRATALDRLWCDPAAVMRSRGQTPDGWQERLLQSFSNRILLLTARQVGKTRAVAALALATALREPGSLTLLLSPSERQSSEMAQRVFDFYDALGKPVLARKRTELQLWLTNGSRVIALPESERTVRGYAGAALLAIDEAARVSEGLYLAVRPMLSVSRGRLIALSTPCGKRGWFHAAWSGSERWQRLKVPATDCRRHTAEFLAEEKRAMGQRWYRQEYECSFEDEVGAVFAQEDIDAALSRPVAPLFG